MVVGGKVAGRVRAGDEVPAGVERDRRAKEAGSGIGRT